MQYRRANIKGSTYFFIINLADRQKTLLTDEFDKLRASLNRVKRHHHFLLDAMLVSPDHLEAVALYTSY